MLSRRSTEPVTHREGGDPSTSRVSPSVWKFEPITLERGVTHDPEFEAWANLIYNTDGDAAISLENFRKDLIIELLNEQGVVAKAYKVYRCWVSEYQALPELDAQRARRRDRAHGAAKRRLGARRRSDRAEADLARDEGDVVHGSKCSAFIR